MVEGRRTKRRRKMAANNRWTECETWAQVCYMYDTEVRQNCNSGHSVRLGVTEAERNG